MLTAASAEMPLLVFSILVPAGLVALGLTGLLRGLAEGEANAKKLDTLALIPAVVVLVGLAASVFHLGSPAHMLGMFAGLGSSPLSNEIACAGLSIAVAAVYVVFALVKHPGAGAHKGFSIALLVLGLATAVMTGLAYAIRTIPTWDGAFGWAGQLCLALLAGSALAALMLAAGNAFGKKATNVLAACAVVGGIGVIAVVFAQGSVAGSVTSSAGATLSALMGDYTTFAAIGSVFAAIAAGCTAACGRVKVSPTVLTAVAVACAIVAAVLVRIDFYGIYLTVGLA